MLNYGWVHSGLWGVIGPLLTTEARAKLTFINPEKLIDYIPISNIPSLFGGLDESFPISYRVCPVIQSFALPLHQQQRSEAVKQIMSTLCYTLEIPISSDNIDVFYDAKTHDSEAKSVKSTADLQQLFPSNLRVGGLGKIHSFVSLSNLTRRTKSNVNLRSKSHISLSHHYSNQNFLGQTSLERDGKSSIPTSNLSKMSVSTSQEDKKGSSIVIFMKNVGQFFFSIFEWISFIFRAISKHRITSRTFLMIILAIAIRKISIPGKKLVR